MVHPREYAQLMGGRVDVILRPWRTDHRGLLMLCVPDGSGIYAQAVVDLLGVHQARARPGDRGLLYWWKIGERHEVTAFRVAARPGLFDVPYGVSRMSTLR